MLLEKYKEEVIQIAKRMCELGLVTGSWGNVSVRPEHSNKLIITPSGMDYFCLNYSDMVALDFSGNILAGSKKPSSEYNLHKEIYMNRSDISAIVHTHSVYATSFAAANISVPVIVEELAQINGGRVEVAKYALPGTIELAKNCVQTLGSKRAVLLANHGLVGVGSTLEEALNVCQVVEITAKIAYLAMNLGSAKEISQEDVSKIRSLYVNDYGQK